VTVKQDRDRPLAWRCHGEIVTLLSLRPPSTSTACCVVELGQETKILLSYGRWESGMTMNPYPTFSGLNEQLLILQIRLTQGMISTGIHHHNWLEKAAENCRTAVGTEDTSALAAALKDVAKALKEGAHAADEVKASWTLLQTLQKCVKARVSTAGLAPYLVETPNAFMVLWTAFLYGEVFETIGIDAGGSKVTMDNRGSKYVIGETRSSTTGEF
jgi:hypothetical protein